MKNKYIRRSLVALSLSTATVTVTAAAQSTQNNSADIAILSPVTVSAGRGVELESLPFSTTVIPREDVINSPESSTDQIINKIPGIFVNQIPSTSLQIGRAHV